MVSGSASVWLGAVVQVASVATATATPAQPCAFHCINSQCGGAGQFVNYTLTYPTDNWSGKFDMIKSTYLHALNLSYRGISSIAPDGLDCYFDQFPGTTDVSRPNVFRTQVVLLDGNLLSAVPLLSHFNTTGAILLRDNPIQGLLPDDLFDAHVGERLYLDLTGCMVVGLASGIFGRFSGTYLSLVLTNNAIIELESDAFTGFTGNTLYIFLATNGISAVPPGLFGGYAGRNLGVDLTNNSLRALPTGMFANFSRDAITVDFTGNDIETLGAVFSGFAGAVECRVVLRDNLLSGVAVKLALSSFTTSSAELVLDASQNRVVHIPPQLFYHVMAAALGYATITVDLSSNPLASIDRAAFAGNSSWLKSLAINVSAPTAGLISNMPTDFDFTGISWEPTSGGIFNVALDGTGVSYSVVQALSVAHGGPTAFILSLRNNHYTEISNEAFSSVSVTALDLRQNQITRFSPSAFNYTIQLETLLLSENNLSVVDATLFSNTPLLHTLAIQDNAIWAVPSASNHIVPTVLAGGNVVQCQEWAPISVGCSCTTGFSLSIHCGYVRCTLDDLPNGCPIGSIFNSSDCSQAPFSGCVLGAVTGQYYRGEIRAFLPLTECAVAFPRDGSFLPAYEVDPPFLTSLGTATTNRLCSVCATCPAGYDTTQCTPTSQTRCIRSTKLSAGDAAAIVLALVILGVSAAVGVVYGRTKSQQRNLTLNELELTEKLLGTVQTEKDRVTNENSLMEQGWRISQTDLAFGQVIGQGAFGTVFKGMWGHIPVAIKILRASMNSLDPTMLDDFNREVKFMRSIRHPHVLTFYGAGVDEQSRAFLVTELMQGSLKTLLYNAAQTLEWNTRLVFARDVACGILYLHDTAGTVHRDLKADNCFVDAALRVKVADFGTGRIASIQETHRDVAPTSNGDSACQNPSWTNLTDNDRSGCTLSKGVGTLLWMAPEVLRGSKVREGQAPAMDVYSYAIVLWEIWALVRPWDEVVGEGIHFSAKLADLVNAGTRPRLPQGCEDAPDGYRILMEECWEGLPENRPSCAIIVERLTAICRRSKSDTQV